ncbi:hypothetical protein [Virgibacillus sp. JSM 102003]|uniref:hypothetical protein n=1 Tax=Virgibacillus sp. JSM 102003 TaxID=1562108 RepID=UPI0035C080B8
MASLFKDNDVPSEVMPTLLHAAGVKADGSLKSEMASIDELLHLFHHEVTSEYITMNC